MIWSVFRRNPSHSDRRLSVQIAILTAALALAVYVRTSSPTLLSAGDSAELTTVAYTLGVAHAPGYPLFTLLGHLVSRVTPGNAAHRIILFTALCGSLAILNTYFVLLLWTGRKGISTLGALTLAFSYHFWLYSLIPEVAALSAFFVSLLFLIVLAGRQPSPPGLSRCLSSPMMLAFVLGLAVSHQYTILLCVPALAGFVYLTRRERGWRVGFREAFFIGVAFLLGLAPFLYLPIRAPQMPFMNAGLVNSLDRFIAHITRRSYGTTGLTPQFSEWTFHGVSTDLQFYGESLLRSFSPWGVALALIGTVRLYRRDRPAFVLWSLAFVMSGPMFLILGRMPADSVVNKTIMERFLIISFVVFALAIGPGMACVVDRLPSYLRKWFEVHPGEKAAAWVLVASLPLWLFARNYPVLDFHRFNLCEIYGRDLLKSFEPHSLVLVNGDNDLFTLWYFQQAEGARPDLWVINANIDVPYRECLRRRYPDLDLPPGILGADLVRDLIRTQISRRPIYIAGVPGNLFAPYGLLGNPYTVQPSGLAMKVVSHYNRASDDSDLWRSFEFQKSTGGRPETDNYFTQEIAYLYGLSRYNAALIYNQNGLADRVAAYVGEACRLDPFFEQLPLALARRAHDPLY